MAVFPSFPEVIGSKSACGIKKETTFRTPVTATEFTPFDACAIDEDPATFSPSTMIGVISTDVYPMQGEVKVAGGIKSPLYATNAIPMLIGSIGKDATAFNGVTGTAAISTIGSPGNTTSVTSFAATGVTSISLASATGSASNQCWLISGSTDPAGGWEVVGGTLASTTITVTSPAGGTTKVHTGTISVKTCGALSNGSVSAAGASITLATGLGALFASTNVVQVDVNGTTTTSELRKVTVAGDVLTISDSAPYAGWSFAHATAVQVVNVTGGLFYHAIPSGDLDSFTVEKNVGGVESLIHPGVRFAKGSLACPSGNAAANLSIDAMGAAQPTVQSNPTSASTTTENPFQFSEGTFKIFGAEHPECYNAKIDWDNVMKETYGYNHTHYANFLTKTDFHVSGSFDAIFHNFDDAADGFWSKMDAQTSGVLDFTLTHADGSLILVHLPLIKLTKVPVDPTVGNVVTQPITFKGFYGLATSTPNMVLTVANTSKYLPY